MRSRRLISLRWTATALAAAALLGCGGGTENSATDTGGAAPLVQVSAIAAGLKVTASATGAQAPDQTVRESTQFSFSASLASGALADNTTHPIGVDAKAREIYAKVISIPTQTGNHAVPVMAEYLAEEFLAAGFAAADVRPPLGSASGPIQNARFPALQSSGRATSSPLGRDAP